MRLTAVHCCANPNGVPGVWLEAPRKRRPRKRPAHGWSGRRPKDFAVGGNDRKGAFRGWGGIDLRAFPFETERPSSKRKREMKQEDRIREPENRVWQTRTHSQTEFERRLADALERAFADGVTDLAPLVDRLNADGLRDEENRAWTEESFRAVMARLGA